MAIVNDISELPRRDANLKKLSILRINQAEFEQFCSNIGERFPALRHLDVQNNSITDTPGGLVNATNLETLNMNNCELTSFPLWLLNSLPKLKNIGVRKNKYMNLLN